MKRDGGMAEHLATLHRSETTTYNERGEQVDKATTATLVVAEYGKRVQCILSDYPDFDVHAIPGPVGAYRIALKSRKAWDDLARLIQGYRRGTLDPTPPSKALRARLDAASVTYHAEGGVYAWRPLCAREACMERTPEGMGHLMHHDALVAVKESQATRSHSVTCSDACTRILDEEE